jgi:large subunit ribosomal protein L13
MLTHHTHATKPKSSREIVRKWHLVDAKGKVLGKVASAVAKLLQGKHKVGYSDHLDMGDAIVIINASEVVVTGRKHIQKIYSNYSGYPGGLHKKSFEAAFAKHPTEIVRRAISGMLPKNKLRDRRLARLHVFAQAHHDFKNELA